MYKYIYIYIYRERYRYIYIYMHIEIYAYVYMFWGSTRIGRTGRGSRGKALRVPGEVLLLRVADRRRGSRQSSQALARSWEKGPRSGRARRSRARQTARAPRAGAWSPSTGRGRYFPVHGRASARSRLEPRGASKVRRRSVSETCEKSTLLS